MLFAGFLWEVVIFCEALCSLLGSSIHADSPGKNIGVGCHPSSMGSPQPRDRTQASHIAGGFFTSWATGKPWGTSRGLLFLQVISAFIYLKSICLELCPYLPYQILKTTLLLLCQGQVKTQVTVRGKWSDRLHFQCVLWPGNWISVST